MTLSFEEKMSRAYQMAYEKYEGFNEMDPEFQHYLSYGFYQQLCYDEEAEYWEPVVKGMEMDEIGSRFNDPVSLWIYQAGEKVY